MRNLTKILAVALTLALLVCGFVIAASAGSGDSSSQLVTADGQVVEAADLNEATSIAYDQVSRDVKYFYTPVGVTVSEGYVVDNTTDEKAGYDRQVRILYAIYDYTGGELGAVKSTHTSAWVAPKNSFSANIHGQSNIAIVLYGDLNLDTVPFANTNNGFVVPKGYFMLDLNGYNLTKTKALCPDADGDGNPDATYNSTNHGGTTISATSWYLIGFSTSNAKVSIVSSYPGGSIDFVKETGSSTGNTYLLRFAGSGSQGTTKATFSDVDINSGALVYFNSNKDTGSTSVEISNVHFTQSSNMKTDGSVLNLYKNAKVTIKDSTFELSQTTLLTTTTATTYRNYIYSSTIDNTVIKSSQAVFGAMNATNVTDSNAGKVGITITNSIIDATLYSTAPAQKYYTLGSGCALKSLPSTYADYCTIDGQTFEATATKEIAGGTTATANILIGTTNENGSVSTFETTLQGITVEKDGFTVTLVTADGKTTYTIKIKTIDVKDENGVLVGEFENTDDAYKALKTGYYIDTEADVDGGVINVKDVAYFYVSNAVDAGEYILSEEATDGYYTATRAAYVVYSGDGTVYSKTADITNFVDPVQAALDDTDIKDCKVVLFADININNDQTATDISKKVFTVAAGDTLTVDLNGHYLGKTGVGSMSADSNWGMFVLTPIGSTTRKTTLNIISSAPNGVIEYKNASSGYSTLVGMASITSGSSRYHYAAGCTVNLGGFEGANGDYLTAKVDGLVWHNMSASTSIQAARQYSNPLSISVKGGTYYCTSGSTSANCNVFTLRTIATVDVEDAVFYTGRAFLYSGTSDKEVLLTANVKNSEIYTFNNGASIRPIVSSNRQYTRTVDALIEILEYEAGSAEALAFEEIWSQDNSVTFEDCILAGYLVSATNISGTVTLVGDNTILQFAEKKTYADVSEYVVFASGTSGIQANIKQHFDKTINFTTHNYVYDKDLTFTYATYYTDNKANRVGQVICDGTDKGEWIVGSAITAKGSKDGVTGLYKYAFKNWINESDEVVTTVAAGNNNLTSTFTLVADITGIKYNVTTENGFILNIYVPKNAAITENSNVTYTYQDVTYVVYSLAVAPGNVEAVLNEVLTVTDGEQTAKQEVTVSLLDYFNDALTQYEGNETVVALVANAVKYCNEVYKIVNDNAEVGYEAYETILAAHAESLITFDAEADEAVNTLDSDVITGITIYVSGTDSTPYLAFVLSGDTTSAITATFTVGGIEDETECTVKTMGDGTVVAVCETMSVYEMAAVMNVSVDGEYVGSINLAHYVTAVNTDNAIANATYGYAIAVYNYKTK